MPSARHGYFRGLSRSHERLSFKLVVLLILDSVSQLILFSTCFRSYHHNGDLTSTLLLVFLRSNAVHTAVHPQLRPHSLIGCFRHSADDVLLKASNLVQAADEREPIALPKKAVSWRSRDSIDDRVTFQNCRDLV